MLEDQLRALLLDIGGCCESSRAILRASGFRSCFVDEDWMHQQATESEWNDYLKYRRQYSCEVMLSKSPAGIEHCDPGEYLWNCEEIADRVAKRYALYGAHAALFANPLTRHLVKLTEPQRQLSRVLERGTMEDAESAEKRLAEFESRQREEESIASGIIERAREQTLHCLPTALSLNQVLASLVKEQINDLTPAAVARLVGTDCKIELVNEVVVLICPRFELKINDQRWSGNVHCKLHVHIPNRQEGRRFLRDDGMTYYHWTLPNRFDIYSRFDTPSFMAVCLAAWTQIHALIAQSLAERGWLRKTPS